LVDLSARINSLNYADLIGVKKKEESATNQIDLLAGTMCVFAVAQVLDVRVFTHPRCPSTCTNQTNSRSPINDPLLQYPVSQSAR
jgi:hypothetical protein